MILTAIRLYRRLVSPMLPAACRYWPSCSAYAEEACVKHGDLKGAKIAIGRLLRCHPLGGHGYDPVKDA